MRKQDDIRIVLGSKRFAGSANVDEQINLNLVGDRRELVQGDRSTIVNINDIFESERQLSNLFRLSGKITNIFENSVSGRTQYNPFKNNLYLLDAEQSINTNVWQGYPQPLSCNGLLQAGFQQSNHSLCLSVEVLRAGRNQMPLSSSSTDLRVYF